MLTIIRDTPTTNPLITFIERAYPIYATNAQTLEYNYRASDLQEIIITNDQTNFNNSLVEIQMTQKVFKCLVSELDVNDSGIFPDIVSLRAGLAAVFPDTNTGGGGGGTTDNSTPIHFVYKSADNTFRDTAMSYDVGNNETIDDAVSQTRNMQANANNGHLVTHSFDLTRHAFIVSGIFQKFMELRKLNSDTDESFSFRLGQGTQFIDIIKNDGVAEYINIGDINELSDSFPKIFMDKLSQFTALSAGTIIIRTIMSLSIQNLQTYANNAAAITGGLNTDDVYKTATGELRIVI